MYIGNQDIAVAGIPLELILLGKGLHSKIEMIHLLPVFELNSLRK